MDRAFRNLDADAASLSKALHSDLVLVKILAEDLERDNESEQVKKLQDATLELIAAADKLERHRQALQALNGSCAPSDETTDFKSLIETEMNKTPAINPKDHHIFKKLNEAIWNVHHAGDPMLGQEEAEIVITTQAGVLNKVCPITGKSVTELQQPVRSMLCRHIYEQRAVLEYIRNKREAACPAAGCPAKITRQSLTSDSQLEMDIQELRLRGTEDRGPAPECTELDDDDD